MHVATADMQMTLRNFIWYPMIFPPVFLFSMIFLSIGQQY